jgi:uncharacterized membrane protein YccC
MFAISSRVIGNAQMATFAAFGGFATLVLASFGGGRKERLLSHLGLAVVGSVLLVIGTAVNSITVLAALVTLPVAFCVLFTGVASANAASGATAALLGYVLPAASPGTIATIPFRLAGWWLASAAGTLAVLILYSPPPNDRLRRTVSASAAALADQLDAALDGASAAGETARATDAKHALLSAYTEVPYRPTGLTVRDQAIAGLVEALQWCTTSIAEAVSESRLSDLSASGRERLLLCRATLRLCAELIDGGPATGLEQAVDSLDGSLMAESPFTGGPDGRPRDEGSLHGEFHSRVVAAAARSVGTDALLAGGRIRPEEAATEISKWTGPAPHAGRFSHHPAVQAAGTLFGGHTSLRSLWFRNSARGAVALAAAVAIADITNVQHGFWVVLGTLSVLRTSAASTGATVLRALLGAVIGVFIGAGLIVGIGSHTAALWVALPVAVLVAAYAPGTAPFAVGQAAFTVTISVLYNIIVPVGWKVGELRLEDVALGAAISAAVGVLFWPRGATRVVADDLADTFHAGGVYLVQAAGSALGLREEPLDGVSPMASPAARLDDALRGLLSEQGTQRVTRETLWRLVGGTLRLRLMANGLTRAGGPHDPSTDDEARAMMGETVRVAGLYDQLADRLRPSTSTVAEEVAGLRLGVDRRDVTDTRALWVKLHLDHLTQNLDELAAPADVVARRLASPWWT